MSMSPEQAWEKEMAKARLTKGNKNRLTYPEAAKRALAAWLAARGKKASTKS